MNATECRIEVRLGHTPGTTGNTWQSGFGLGGGLHGPYMRTIKRTNNHDLMEHRTTATNKFARGKTLGHKMKTGGNCGLARSQQLTIHDA